MSIPPNLRRYLPFVLVAFFLVLVLPSLFKKSTAATAGTPATQAAATIGALALVDRSELGYQAAHGRYTPHLADLIVGNGVLAHDLANGLAIQLDVGSDGQSYYALVESPVLSLIRARHDRTISAQNCVIVKTGSGVACPAPAH